MENKELREKGIKLELDRETLREDILEIEDRLTILEVDHQTLIEYSEDFKKREQILDEKFEETGKRLKEINFAVDHLETVSNCAKLRADCAESRAKGNTLCVALGLTILTCAGMACLFGGGQNEEAIKALKAEFNTSLEELKKENQRLSTTLSNRISESEEGLKKELKNTNRKTNKRISNLKQFMKNKISSLSKDLDNEIARRQASEKDLKEGINNEFNRHSERVARGEKSLEVRNVIWERMLDDFLNGRVSPSEFRENLNAGVTDRNFMKFTKDDNNDFSWRLSLSLYRYLAPSYGISLDYLNSRTLMESMNDSRNSSNFVNLVRGFKY